MANVKYLFDRRNSLYKSRESIWDRARLAYQGGDDYISTALVQHCSELDSEFAERKKRECDMRNACQFEPCVLYYNLSQRKGDKNVQRL